jgi:hypothetical protein
MPPREFFVLVATTASLKHTKNEKLFERHVAQEFQRFENA